MQIKKVSNSDLICMYKKLDAEFSLFLSKQKNKSVIVKNIPKKYSDYFIICAELKNRGLE